MCGRFTLTITFDDLREYFQVAGPPQTLSPRYNITPSQDVAAVRLEEGKRRLAFLRWGLIPFWAEDPKIGYRTINARAETLLKKPAFRAAFRKRRCLIPASGFFEWLKKGKEKQPYYIYRRDGNPMALAGLYERWRDEKVGRDIESCTIITTAANQLVTRLHDRMPVILEADDFGKWLDPEEESPGKLTPLLKPPDEGVLEMYPVSSYVNKPQNEGEKCIEPEGEPKG